VEFFYTPDKAPISTASSSITAYADLNDNLIVFRADGLGFVQIPNGIEFGDSQQSTPEGAGFGVLKQEHVAQGRNNIYFLNPSEGVLRLGGSISTIVSRPVDAILKSITDLGKTYLSLHRGILRCYYNVNNKGYNERCLLDYTNYAIHKSYWYRDGNTPIAYMNSDNGYDREIGVGSQYPCVIEAESGYSDFAESDPDTGQRLTPGNCIVYEYHTGYLASPSKLNSLIVRRLHVVTLQDFASSLFIGMDVDHKNIPMVFRAFIPKLDVEDKNPEGIFDPETIGDVILQVGSWNVDIPTLTDQVGFVQIRLKQYCYDGQAEIASASFEYGEESGL
jgi:hypothetical protein